MKTINYILFLVLVSICFVSCRPKYHLENNGIYVYAPNNSVKVAGISQSMDNTNIPVYETIEDGQLHYISTQLLHDDAGGPLVYPDLDYRFQIKASIENEYYVLIHDYIEVNEEWGTLMDFCERYTPNVVIRAIKQQQPDKIICISSTATQYIDGVSMNQIFYLGNLKIKL